MKVAIMTLPLGHNYGGIIQNWALQQVLKKMGHEPITIDRRQGSAGQGYQTIRLGYRFVRKVMGKRGAPINFERYFPTVFQNTQRFINKEINISESLKSTDELKTHFDNHIYDAVVVGSDQTWRPRYVPNVRNFFLDFLKGSPTKRIAYACSFGVDHWEYTEEQTRVCSELARQFDSVSVREESGVLLCKEHLGVDAQHVLDPTLLIEREDYEELIGAKRLTGVANGVYTYFLDKTPEKLDMARRMSDELGEPVYSCQAKYKVSEEYGSRIEDYIMPDIRDWLAGFANARCILTDSFHGMIFAGVFGKKFGVIVNTKRGGTRFSSLSKLLGLPREVLLDSIGGGRQMSNKVPCVSEECLRHYSDISHEFLHAGLEKGRM